MLGVLQAPPHTALWNRLEQEGRLLEDRGCIEYGDQNTLMNFVPTRPLAEIAHEYVEALWTMYEPAAYLARCLRHCQKIKTILYFQQQISFPLWKGAKLVARLVWQQGIRMGEIRRQFWQQLWTMATTKPRLLGLYLGLCAAGGHFWEYRELARERIGGQLGYDPLLPLPEEAAVAARSPVVARR